MESDARTEARAFLLTLLADGPQPAALVLAAARQSGITITLRRVKLALGIVVERQGFGPGSTLCWRLP